MLIGFRRLNNFERFFLYIFDEFSVFRVFCVWCLSTLDCLHTTLKSNGGRCPLSLSPPPLPAQAFLSGFGEIEGAEICIWENEFNCSCRLLYAA